MNSICEDSFGYPCILKMSHAKRKYKFSPMDYGTVVREMVQGLVDVPAGEIDEWEQDTSWKESMGRGKRQRGVRE